MQPTHTKLQPKHNDSLAHCNHLDDADAPHHWFYSPDGLMRRPDGSHFRPQWLACCDACFRASGKNVHAVPFRGDGLWVGDEPIILASWLR